METYNADAMQARVQWVLVRWERALEEPCGRCCDGKNDQPRLLGQDGFVCFPQHECKRQVCDRGVDLLYSGVLRGVEQDAQDSDE